MSKKGSRNKTPIQCNLDILEVLISVCACRTLDVPECSDSSSRYHLLGALCLFFSFLDYVLATFARIKLGKVYMSVLKLSCGYLVRVNHISTRFTRSIN